MPKSVVIISTDPLADMLSRVRNAMAVNKQQVSLPHSQLKETVAKILVDSGFLADVQSGEENGRKTLTIASSQPETRRRINL
jgi:small subunit ribosomal protein S8